MSEKKFTPRTSIGTLDNSEWMSQAVARTGVSLGNCFTYAMARISEIVNYVQPLDGASRVRGAGDLWEVHDKAFVTSNTPVPGALAIFKGGSDNFGHVSVVEVVEESHIWMSQSAYGNNSDTDSDGLTDGFSFVKISKNIGSYYGSLKLVGYLIHQELKNTVSNKIINEEEDTMSIAFIRIKEDLSAKVKKGNIYLFNSGARTYKHLSGDQYNAAVAAFPKAVVLEATKAANFFSLLSGALGATEI